jgi:hypothetical protein
MKQSPSGNRQVVAMFRTLVYLAPDNGLAEVLSSTLEVSFNDFGSWFILLDPIRASAISRNNVFYALDFNAGAKYPAEEIQFCAAKSFAGIGSSTDWAVVLYQEEASFSLRSNLGHISFVRPNTGQSLELFLQRNRSWYLPRVAGPLVSVADVQHTVQPCLTECISKRVNE